MTQSGVGTHLLKALICSIEPSAPPCRLLYGCDSSTNCLYVMSFTGTFSPSTATDDTLGGSIDEASDTHTH